MDLKNALIGLGLLAALPAAAQSTGYVPPPRSTNLLAGTRQDEKKWERNAHFFVGTRGGVAIPAGGKGVSPTMGIELGVANTEGIGFGLHLMGATNTAAVPGMNIPSASYAFGAALDMRFYFQTVEPLTLYPTFSVGFMAGPSKEDGTNVVLPMFNPGFGARVKTGNLYTSFEFGLASFTIPFVNVGLGYEFDKPTPPAQPLVEPPRPVIFPDQQPASGPPPLPTSSRLSPSPESEWARLQ